MKNKFNLANISHANTEYTEGSIEIDDETREIVFRAMKRSPFSKKEIILETTKYDEKAFPKIENNYLETSDVKALVPDEQERQRIIELVTSPQRDLARTLRKKISDNLHKAEKSMEDILVARASSFDYLSILRMNPRKTLFMNSPELLSTSAAPIQPAVEKQREKISASLTVFKDALLDQTAKGELTQKARDKIYEFAISIGTVQDAVFEGNNEKLEIAKDLLRKLDLRPPDAPSSSVLSFTEALIIDLSTRKHALLEEELFQSATN